MKPMTFIQKLVLTPKEHLFPEQEKLITEFYDGNYREFLGILGRRSGKDYLLRLMTAYECHRLLELDDPCKHYGLPRGNPIYILLLGPSSTQAKILFTEVKHIFSSSSYFRDRIDKIESDRIWFKDGQGKPSICVVSSSATGAFNSLLGKHYFCLVFNEIACWPRDYAERVYSAFGCTLSWFKQDGHIIAMTNPGFEDGIVHQFANDHSPHRLVWHKATWEMNPGCSREQLQLESKYLSEEEFNSEFGAKFRISDDNVTISIRLSSSQLRNLKRAARVQAYESDTDLSHVDLIRTAVEDYLEKIDK